MDPVPASRPPGPLAARVHPVLQSVAVLSGEDQQAGADRRPAPTPVTLPDEMFPSHAESARWSRVTIGAELSNETGTAKP
jgi:hypothetical protein